MLKKYLSFIFGGREGLGTGWTGDVELLGDLVLTLFFNNMGITPNVMLCLVQRLGVFYLLQLFLCSNTFIHCFTMLIGGWLCKKY